MSDIKVTVDFDDEDYSLQDQIVSAIGQSAYNWVRMPDLIDRAKKDLGKKVDDEVAAFKTDMKSWKVENILLEFHKVFGQGMITSVTSKVIENLSKDKNFISAVATEVIKKQFK